MLKQSQQFSPPSIWQRVGIMASQAIQNGQAVWCNTHGHGFPWMHVRFDPNHKYAAFPLYGVITLYSQQQWYDNIYTPIYGEI